MERTRTRPRKENETKEGKRDHGRKKNKRREKKD